MGEEDNTNVGLIASYPITDHPALLDTWIGEDVNDEFIDNLKTEPYLDNFIKLEPAIDLIDIKEEVHVYENESIESKLPLPDSSGVKKVKVRRPKKAISYSEEFREEVLNYYKDHGPAKTCTK